MDQVPKVPRCVRAVACYFATLGVACGARTALLDGANGDLEAQSPGAESTDAVPDTESPPREPPDAESPDVSPSPSAQCTAVGPVSATPSDCWIDEQVSNRSAMIVYPCDGGAGTAVFGVAFTGSVVGGQVDLAATTTFPWSDGCTWQSDQRIAGELQSGALTYTYQEHPISGSNCEPATCTATTPVLVQ
jgi:hypothetical protein